MRILTASDRALLVEAADLDEAMRLNLAWADVAGIDELIPAARTVLVRFDPLRISASELATVLRTTRIDAAHVPHVRDVTIPVRYDGEDLEDVSTLLGESVEAVIARHLAAEWQVAFSGFAPGFGYAVSSDPLFDVPRRSSPRTRVPAGSVALAGHFTGVYPRESPGGWQLIGHTDAAMWDIDRDPPALLSPGTSVRFERADREAVVTGSRTSETAFRLGRSAPSLNDQNDNPRSLSEERQRRDETLSSDDQNDNPRSLSDTSSATSAPRIEIVRASLQLLVQDLGRPGHAALGVSASGAADRTAVRDANRAVGNARGAGVLESVGGAVLRFHGADVAAVTGAMGEITLTDRDGVRRSIPHGVPFALADGDELQLGHPDRGLRFVIAVRGGIVAPPSLGSVSTDTLAGLGPEPLAVSDVVALGDPRTAPHAVSPQPIPRRLPASGETVELEITLGPRDDWFTEPALDALLGQDWEVTPRSDRVGIRLQGEVPLERAVAGELPSEGAVTGAIQVPPDGQPVLFLPDHPLTGGYPIIGALTDRSLDLAGQLPPGVRIRFVAATGAEPVAHSAEGTS
ncbi:urea amidolyase family protein [Microbacterium sp. LWH12-1.2]|uniref:5-oxoprolinase subunit B/C family protein n=1 Tax=Microbacterium sp. LWH12-1.2 TaxID=3135259 RepID=UPI0034278D61